MEQDVVWARMVFRPRWVHSDRVSAVLIVRMY
jgi:hypothetical protein